MGEQGGVEGVFIHCFLDGRDTPPSSGADYVAALQKKIEDIGCGRIATVIGRYYAMDRDQRWERIQRAYDLLVNAGGARAQDPVTTISESDQRAGTDEFVEPLVGEHDKNGHRPTMQGREAPTVVNCLPD